MSWFGSKMSGHAGLDRNMSFYPYKNPRIRIKISASFLEEIARDLRAKLRK